MNTKHTQKEKKRNIGQEILEGIREIKAWQQEKKKLKVPKITFPSSDDVSPIRHHLGLSQQAFAAFMGVSVATIRNWEQGRREPHGPARTLLLIAKNIPDAFSKAFDIARKAA